MPVGKWIPVRFRTSRRLEAEMSQISEGSALVLALACALWIYEVTKVIHAQRNRLISRPATTHGRLLLSSGLFCSASTACLTGIWVGTQGCVPSTSLNG
jgi:hypothetical protein